MGSRSVKDQLAQGETLAEKLDIVDDILNTRMIGEEFVELSEVLMRAKNYIEDVEKQARSEDKTYRGEELGDYDLPNIRFSILYVQWLDAQFTETQVHHSELLPGLGLITSCGFLVHEDESRLTLSRDSSDNGNVRGVQTIPKQAIVHRAVLQAVTRDDAPEWRYDPSDA